jgi:hypothetical protein
MGAKFVASKGLVLKNLIISMNSIRFVNIESRSRGSLAAVREPAIAKA